MNVFALLVSFLSPPPIKLSLFETTDFTLLFFLFSVLLVGVKWGVSK